MKTAVFLLFFHSKNYKLVNLKTRRKLNICFLMNFRPLLGKFEPGYSLIACTFFRTVHPSRSVCEGWQKMAISIFGTNIKSLKSILSSWHFFSYLNIELGDQLFFMTFSISFISKHGLFSKNVPNFLWLSIKQSYKISKNLLRIFTWM